MMLRTFVSLRLALAALLLAVAAVGLPALAQTPAPELGDHSRHHAEAAVANAAAGPFATDAPLRAGMSQVRDSVESLAALSASSSGSAVDKVGIDEARVLDLSAEIQTAIESMFANCKLPPDADAALHPLLAELIQATTALNDAPSTLQPVAKMQGVLARYGEQFHDADADQSDGH